MALGQRLVVNLSMPAATATLLGLIPLAYVIGSIPFGLLVGWAKGIDVRRAGSGNIGATNVGRLLGRRFFYLVFLLDAVKGLAVMVLAGLAVSAAPPSPVLILLWLAVGFAAIAGHMFSCFLRFRGGKGVATSAGVLLGLWPYFTIPAAAALLLFAVVLKTTRYMSIASMTAALAFPLAFVLIGLWANWHPLGERLPLLVFSLLVAGMIVYRHRSNITRLRAGTEAKF